ncbi:hypothetical protein CFK37_03825 [Virgibacillus phasianinus]|uniref:Uncharacterized protein n=1 Tax=Virgibacillus phasianinus TaxID=2017483 RepID=A0A220U0I2_9BACI|nr:DUF5592 family protein [Virgibacillus phasianinus]ASK61361.1 hypothetical protein CFK37_03825 [Virgibacillus phasianinus]
MKYEIPKEIKAKPKILGLVMRELVILLISSLLLLTILQDLVHSVFIIPYFAVAIVGMIYLLMLSGSNPKKKNYESLILLFRHKKGTFHPIDLHKQQNIYLREKIKAQRRPNPDESFGSSIR